MEMVICQETPSHGKNIYGNLTAARHAPSKKVRYTRYYRFLRCAFLSVKQNYGKIRPRRAAVVCLPMSNLFSISKILSVTINMAGLNRFHEENGDYPMDEMRFPNIFRFQTPKPSLQDISGPAMSCHGKGACRDEEHVPHQLWTSMGPLAALAAAQLCIFLLHLVL